jgi:hypothetical protein
MAAMGHSGRLKYLAGTSAITLNADIRLHCNICRNVPQGDMNGAFPFRPSPAISARWPNMAALDPAALVMEGHVTPARETSIDHKTL